jgi:Methionine biosynthesis protein MetW
VPTSPSAAGADPADEAGQANASEALHAAFARLAPQGSDPWNFMAAFTHLADRYGPDHPGASAMAELLNGPDTAAPRLSRLRPRGVRSGAGDARGSGSGSGSGDLEEAMGHVIEAFRFLNARVRTLEDEVARRERPVDGAAWLAPAAELGEWTALVSAHIAGAAPRHEVLHADCGDGALLSVLREAGIAAAGIEPRGMVALHPLEQGHRVVIAEVTEVLPGLPARSTGGLVLSGVVDRVPVHVLVPLLAQAERTLVSGAPIVIVTTDPEVARSTWSATTADLVEARPLHASTWESLLGHAGFIDFGFLHDSSGDTRRIGLHATVAR